MDEECLNREKPRGRDWRRIVTSAAKHEFTMRHLLKRRFGSSNEAVRDCLTGESSFSGCILRNFGRDPLLSNIKCVPSKNRIEPGKQGYYNGGWIVRSHAELAMVDSVQIELPMTVRCQPNKAREAAITALAAAISQFHSLHYRETGGNETDRHVNGKDLSKTR